MASAPRRKVTFTSIPALVVVSATVAALVSAQLGPGPPGTRVDPAEQQPAREAPRRVPEGSQRAPEPTRAPSARGGGDSPTGSTGSTRQRSSAPTPDAEGSGTAGVASTADESTPTRTPDDESSATPAEQPSESPSAPPEDEESEDPGLLPVLPGP